ncbi:hypothetical protein REC12_02825 [Desulfosporosinus sp. PR]|nr:hypothetical protein [Desulfosporosinus sp. PR]
MPLKKENALFFFSSITSSLPNCSICYKSRRGPAFFKKAFIFREAAFSRHMAYLRLIEVYLSVAFATLFVVPLKLTWCNGFLLLAPAWAKSLWQAGFLVWLPVIFDIRFLKKCWHALCYVKLYHNKSD